MDVPSTGRFGRYEILCPLGVGGMGEVVLARLRGIGGFEKLLVLKRLLPERASDEGEIALFLDEARLVATLAHPNIVQVQDVGVLDGRYFIAMEYVHGQDLRRILEAGTSAGRRLSLEETLAIVIPVCAGLHYAHTKTSADGGLLGIVHRDVTPSNVLVGYDGQVKVTDFGIASAVGAGSAGGVGPVRGKAHYMSPEQWRGAAVDARSDVFSIGVLLYELTTGTTPHPDGSDQKVRRAVLAGPPSPPSGRARDYPTHLEHIVMTALDPAPDARFASAQAVQLELEAFAHAQGLMASSRTVARLLSALFAPELEAWTLAVGVGTALGDHVARTVTMATSTPRALHGTVGGSSKRRPRRRRWAVAGAAVSLAAAGGAAALWLGGANSADDRLARKPPARDMLAKARAVPVPPSGPASAPATVTAPSIRVASPRRIHPKASRIHGRAKRGPSRWNPDSLLPPR